MLNKKIIETIFAELNESADREWREDRYLSLVQFEDLDDDEVNVVFDMGKDDVTRYTCVFAPDGYEYSHDGSGSNFEDAESVMELLMDQYDSPHFFNLESDDMPGWYKLTDEANGISVTWRGGQFNDTQQFDTSGFDFKKYGMESAQIIATIIRRMADWLADNYRELVEELNERQLFGVKMSRLRKSKLLSIRELAERTDLATNTILNIEKGKFSPRLEIVERILSELGAHLEIVEEDDDMDYIDDDIDDYLEDLSELN